MLSFLNINVVFFRKLIIFLLSLCFLLCFLSMGLISKTYAQTQISPQTSPQISSSVQATDDFKKMITNHQNFSAQLMQTQFKPLNKAKQYIKSSQKLASFDFLAPDYFVWRYQPIGSQTILSDGQNIYIYEARLAQIVKKPAKNLLQQSPIYFIFNKNINNFFDIQKTNLEKIRAADPYILNLINLNNINNLNWYSLSLKSAANVNANINANASQKNIQNSSNNLYQNIYISEQITQNPQTSQTSQTSQNPQAGQGVIKHVLINSALGPALFEFKNIQAQKFNAAYFSAIKHLPKDVLEKERLH